MVSNEIQSQLRAQYNPQGSILRREHNVGCWRCCHFLIVYVRIMALLIG